MSKLVTIARVSTLEETLVIASLLESSDMHCTVADRHVGVVHWGYQIALGGFRLMVYASDAATARDIIVSCAADANVPLSDRPGRRVSERVKPGCQILAESAVGIVSWATYSPVALVVWALPLVAVAILAWRKSPGREFIPPDDITELP